MSGFQDDKASGGGEVQPQVYVPNPSAVRATVEAQISAAEQSTDAAIQAARAGFKSKKQQIAAAKESGVWKAADARDAGIELAAKPVADQIAVIAELRRQLRAEELSLVSKKVVFRAAKGEVKGAFKEAVAGVKSAARSELDVAKDALEQTITDAEDALEQKRSTGGDTIAQEKELLKLYKQWESDVKWAGRKAGLNAVADSIVAIVNAVKETYKVAAANERANVQIPAVLQIKRPDAPTPPSV